MFNIFQDGIIQVIKMIGEHNTILVNEIIKNRNIIESIKSDKQKDIEIKELQNHILKITNEKALVIEELNHKLLIAKRESQIRGLKIHELESSFNKRNEKIKQQNKNIKYLSEKLKSIEVKEVNQVNNTLKHNQELNEIMLNHKKMWEWIANKIKQKGKTIDICDAKNEYCRINNIEPKYKCQLCDYTYKKSKELKIDSKNKCILCPCTKIVDGKKIGGCLNGLYSKVLEEIGPYGNQYNLALEIANLPVINEIKYDEEIKPEVKAKFKVGDTVTIKDGLEINKVYQGEKLTKAIYNDCYNKDMKIKIVLIYETGEITYICDNGHCLSEEILEHSYDWEL